MSLWWTALTIVGPYLWRTFQRLQAEARSAGPPVPIPAEVRKALNILFVTILGLLAATLPTWTPENIFTATSSRLQTPTNVLFERLSALRPHRALTELDDLLRQRLVNTDARCLYLKHGPDALANCRFCNSDDPRSFLVYELPTILFPHIANLFVIGLVTSGIVSGKEGRRWRLQFVLAGCFVAVADLYLVNAYDWRSNATVTRPQDLTHFWWNMRLLRSLALVILDAGIAGLLWLSSTRRMFASVNSSAEKINSIIGLMSSTQKKLNDSAILRNATFRQAGHRKKVDLYWERDGDVMGEVMAEPEVVVAVQHALSSRINVTRLTNDATTYTEGLFGNQENRG